MNIAQRGDRAFIVSFDEEPSAELTQKLAAFALKTRSVPGVIDAVPGYRTVLVESNDPSEQLRLTIGSIDPGRSKNLGRTWRLPCRYDGPDLDWISDFLSMNIDEIIHLHSELEYMVVVVGSPKFIYLSRVPTEIELPRLPNPRMTVPAGTVGIGGKQTGIYGVERPGGWRLIGRVSDVSVLPQMGPGDRVRFVPK